MSVKIREQTLLRKVLISAMAVNLMWVIMGTEMGFPMILAVTDMVDSEGEVKAVLDSRAWRQVVASSAMALRMKSDLLSNFAMIFGISSLLARAIGPLLGETVLDLA